MSRQDCEKMLSIVGRPPMFFGSYALLSVFAQSLNRPSTDVWRDAVLALDLAGVAGTSIVRPSVDTARRASADDFAQWDALQMAMGAEMGMPRNPSEDARRQAFSEQCSKKLAFAAFDGPVMAATAIIGSILDGTIGVVVGVFCSPQLRRRGHARAAMQLLIAAARDDLALTQVALFTEPEGQGSHLYRTLGFGYIGDYCFM